jgi:NAD(P) transhydrogenase subunit beta
MSTAGINLLYLVTIVCFILALRFLSSPATARRGNQIGAVGMVIAIVATLLKAGVHLNWEMVVAALVGGTFGAVAARRVQMTAMPQMVALFNGVGGGAAALVALAEFHELAPTSGRIHGDVSIAILLSALIGSISFSGSLIAFAKLQELIQGRPITYTGQKVVNAALFLTLVGIGVAIVSGAEHQSLGLF